MFLYFMAICNILRTFGIFYDHLVPTFCVHLVHFYGFVIMYREKSGNPGFLDWHGKEMYPARRTSANDDDLRLRHRRLNGDGCGSVVGRLDEGWRCWGALVVVS
jgi:hypothetical protein